MMESEPKTESETNDKILKIDEFKNFLIKKNELFTSFIKFYRETNSKYNKDKWVDEQINKLEIMTRDGLKLSIDSLEMYQKCLITGEKKYYNQSQELFEKVQLLKGEVTLLITDIAESLIYEIDYKQKLEREKLFNDEMTKKLKELGNMKHIKPIEKYH